MPKSEVLDKVDSIERKKLICFSFVLISCRCKMFPILKQIIIYSDFICTCCTSTCMEKYFWNESKISGLLWQTLEFCSLLKEQKCAKSNIKVWLRFFGVVSLHSGVQWERLWDDWVIIEFWSLQTGLPWECS